MEFYDRNKLYGEVWSEPLTSVAKYYGVSDVAIKKACRQLNVLTPGRGYWQKVRNGARIDKPRLAPANGEIARHEKPRLNKQMGNAGLDAGAVVTSQVEMVPVADKLTHPHALVAKTFERMKNYWKASRDKEPVLSLFRGILNVRVSKSSAERALCIMDALLKYFEKQGFSIECGNDRPSHTIVVIDGE